MEERSAGCIIFRKDNGKLLFLLLHYPAGHWDFPKGKIEKGETYKQTVRREVMEETGIGDIKFINGFSDKSEYFYRRDKNLIHKIVVFYLATTKTRNVRLSDEHIGFEWLEAGDADKRLTFKNSKDFFERAVIFLRG